jgi:hypothetical protein
MTALALSLALASASFAGVGNYNALYLGGTINTVKAGDEGRLDVSRIGLLGFLARIPEPARYAGLLGSGE